MRVRDYASRPAHIIRLRDSDPAIRWQVMRDLTKQDSSAVGAERCRFANEGWGSRLPSRQSRAGNWAEPDEDRGLLIPFYSFVFLMDIGLDPASKQARKVIERIEKHFVFRPRNNRPFLRGDTEPRVMAGSPPWARISRNRTTHGHTTFCGNSSKMAAGTASQPNHPRNHP